MQSASRAQHYREEARRIRRDAEGSTTEDEIRRQMLDIAAQYDRLADSADLHAKIGR
jgi:hypothetical protein